MSLFDEVTRFQASVPANSTRYFDTFETASSQVVAELDLIWDADRRIIRNSRFDGSRIVYDNSYCTSVVNLARKAQLPTLEYFAQKILPLLGYEKRVVDIGCGQGEFVEALRTRGFEASGYDPVLKNETEYLRRRLWSPSESQSADLFVMRCVLPHIEDWECFLDELFEEHPGALVLIEFQSFEWVAANGIWQQLCHDHVNIFTSVSFSPDYRVVAKGSFAGGEWEFVLLGKARERREPRTSSVSPSALLTRLAQQRFECLMLLEKLESSITIWGAAGKGQVLSHALNRGQELLAVDADPARWGKFLEASGAEVFSPEDAMQIIGEGTLILVSNPRHVDEIVNYVGSMSKVFPVNNLLPGLLRNYNAP